MSVGPVEALERIAWLCERDQEPTYRVRAYRGAATTLAGMGPAEMGELAGRGRLRELPGIGEKTAAVVEAVLAGEVPSYLAELEGRPGPDPGAGAELLAALRGDCHSHSNWSDGGSPIPEMATAAADLGHDYLVLTDHSARLTVAHGLSAERLVAQIDVVEGLAEEVAPMRLLTGIEVDILDDGSLDGDEDLLGRLDVVVASVHSKLAMEAGAMTRRMVAALSNPLVDVLGHCTGRLVAGRARDRGSSVHSDRPGRLRAESSFDAAEVFAVAAELGKAVEINCRPERLDPPRRLLRQAVAAGCLVAIDTDAHAPGQLAWQPYGCARAAECGVTQGSVVNTWPVGELLAWTGGHRRGVGRSPVPSRAGDGGRA